MQTGACENLSAGVFLQSDEPYASEADDARSNFIAQRGCELRRFVVG
jgi:hypothetical protein